MMVKAGMAAGRLLPNRAATPCNSLPPGAFSRTLVPGLCPGVGMNRDGATGGGRWPNRGPAVMAPERCVGSGCRCERCNSGISTKTLWTDMRGGLVASRDADQGLPLAQEAQFVNVDKDPAGRRVVGLAASQETGAPTRERPSVREAQFGNFDKDPMDRRAVGLAASRDAGAPSTGDHWVGPGHYDEAGTGGSTLFANPRNDLMQQSGAVGLGPRHLSRWVIPRARTDHDRGTGRGQIAGGAGYDDDGRKGEACFSQKRAATPYNSLLSAGVAAGRLSSGLTRGQG